MSKTVQTGGDDAARMVEALILEVLGAFFDLRAAGQRYGLVTEHGGGSWGLLRMLRAEGPLTVSDVARMRSVSRQYIQKLANELIAEGLVTMKDNPSHRQSKFMVLTKRGERRLTELTQRLKNVTRELAPVFSVRDLRVSVGTVATLRKHLAELATKRDA